MHNSLTYNKHTHTRTPSLALQLACKHAHTLLFVTGTRPPAHAGSPHPVSSTPLPPARVCLGAAPGVPSPCPPFPTPLSPSCRVGGCIRRHMPRGLLRGCDHHTRARSPYFLFPLPQPDSSYRSWAVNLLSQKRNRGRRQLCRDQRTLPPSGHSVQLRC